MSDRIIILSKIFLSAYKLRYGPSNQNGVKRVFLISLGLLMPLNN